MLQALYVESKKKRYKGAYLQNRNSVAEGWGEARGGGGTVRESAMGMDTGLFIPEGSSHMEE